MTRCTVFCDDSPATFIAQGHIGLFLHSLHQKPSMSLCGIRSTFDLLFIRMVFCVVHCLSRALPFREYHVRGSGLSCSSTLYFTMHCLMYKYMLIDNLCAVQVDLDITATRRL